jgi:hypothetical protein
MVQRNISDLQNHFVVEGFFLGPGGVGRADVELRRRPARPPDCPFPSAVIRRRPLRGSSLPPPEASRLEAPGSVPWAG